MTGAYDVPVSTAYRHHGWARLAHLAMARVVAGVLAGVLALSGCAGLTGDREGHDRAGSAVPSLTATDGAQSEDPSLKRESAMADLLRERAAAVLAHSRPRFAATLDSPVSAFGKRQLAAFDALARLPLGTFSYGTVEPAPELAADRVATLGDGAWVARVQGQYSLKGFDRSPRAYESYFTAVRRGSAWRLADDRDGGTQQQLWDLPGLQVVSSTTALVVGNAPKAALREYLALGQQAVRDVSKVWTTPWRRRVVLVAPATTAQMGSQLNSGSTAYPQVAAVTDGQLDATTGLAGADRIVINPTAFRGLRPSGRAVVVSHESTHVAVRSTTPGQVPLWMSEGLADYVGYRSLDLPRAQIAGGLMKLVRAGKGPTALPAAVDFDPSRSTIAPSYNAAWLASCLIADTWGTDGLVRFYRSAAAGGAQQVGDAAMEARTDKAFTSVLGLSRKAFTKRWLTYLQQLSRS